MLELSFSLDEIARRGDALYERDVLPHVTDAEMGHIAAIDVATGSFAIDPDQLAAGDRVLARHPDAVLWFRRIGADYVHRFGGRSLARQRPPA